MKQVLIQRGGVIVPEVPAPEVAPKAILVRVMRSCISVGTELAGVKMSAMPLYRRALKQPQHVRKVAQMMRDQGVKRTLSRVLGMLASGTPTGYSACGQIIEIGSEVEGFRVGDTVACAGAGIANHAEFIAVPVNLAVLLPENVSVEHGSTVTLGAIALQGVRRCCPTLGETITVLGLGILGQLTVQLLEANGCRVIGIDLDPRRVSIAKENGMQIGIDPGQEDPIERIHMLTGGFGADAVIITAASPSNQVISDAMNACRKKGRVVLVGDVGLDLKRHEFYKKELDFFISCSYGPGRYDTLYEEGGNDYPLPYVRWTENRNMEAYLVLLAQGRIKLSNFTAKTFPVGDASAAFQALAAPAEKPLLVFLDYPSTATGKIQRRISLRSPPAKSDRIRVALAGAGGFALGMHLPNLVKLRSRFQIRAIMSRTGANARGVAQQFEAAYATTDFNEVLADPDVDLVLICTRHDLHAELLLKALAAGKNVLVEKPLATTESELDRIRAYLKSSSTPVLMTGFNRRFAPAISKCRALLEQRATPLIINYRMNAGFIPLEHWTHGPEGGGRNIGEACHIYDLFNYLTGSTPVAVHAASARPESSQWSRKDNFIATISYHDGSICTLTYTAFGSKSYPKERMEVFCQGRVIELDDYKTLSITGSKQKGWSSLTIEKGQLEEMKALADCLQNQGDWPISAEEQISATEISLSVESQI